MGLRVASPERAQFSSASCQVARVGPAHGFDVAGDSDHQELAASSNANVPVPTNVGPNETEGPAIATHPFEMNVVAEWGYRAKNNVISWHDVSRLLSPVQCWKL